MPKKVARKTAKKTAKTPAAKKALPKPLSAALRSELDQITTPNDPGLPIYVLVGEAVEVAKFVAKRWAPSGGLPGLQSAGSKLDRGIGDEVLQLREALQARQTAYQLAVDPPQSNKGLVAEGERVLSELTAVLEWYFDDGINDDNDVKLAALVAAHAGRGAGADPLAQALSDYATLAKPHAAALKGLGDFDTKTIDRAFELALALGEVAQAVPPRSDQASRALLDRNRAADALWKRLRLVRAAARFVFRDRPRVIGEVASSYLRRQRAEHRRKAAAKAAGTTGPA